MSLKDLARAPDEPIRFFFTAPSPTTERSSVVLLESPWPPQRHDAHGSVRYALHGEDLPGKAELPAVVPKAIAAPGFGRDEVFVPKAAERPKLLPTKKRSQDVGRVTADLLSSAYEPFESVRAVVVRQASDVLFCKFFGDLPRFKSEFLEPVAQLLDLIKAKVSSKDMSYPEIHGSEVISDF